MTTHGFLHLFLHVYSTRSIAIDPTSWVGRNFPFYTEAKPRWFKDQYKIRHYAETSGFSTTCGVSGSNFVIGRRRRRSSRSCSRHASSEAGLRLRVERVDRPTGFVGLMALKHVETTHER